MNNFRNTFARLLARDEHKEAVEATNERRRRFQLFAAHGVSVERNPYTPPGI